jgi:protein-S-isoprenylcysteine O-methyltransferase Ste14
MLYLQFFLRLVFAGLFYSALVIGPVWLLTDSLSWPRGWLAVGVLWGTQVIGGLWFLKTDPDLLEERMSPGENSTPDKLATLLIVILLLCWFVANPLDVLLFQLLPPPPATLSLFGGLVLYAAGLAIVTWTFRTNSFAASVVTVQEERGQQVIDTGPYAYVRHPMYAGLIPLFAGLSLIMESSATALFVIPMVVFGFLPRVMIEEATLRRDLEGYDEYLSRTRWRLLPGVV